MSERGMSMRLSPMMHNPPSAAASAGLPPAAWNATDRPRPAGLRLHDLVQAQVDARPDAVAVVSGHGEALSYAALGQRAAAVQAALTARGVGRGDRVGLAVDRGAELVPALLGILQAGAAWVPLDPSLPAARLAWLVDDAQLAALVTDPAGDAALTDVEVPRVRLGELSSTPAAGPAPAPEPAEPDDVAVLMYTSGSTGRPKGALLTHRGLVNLVLGWAEEPGLGPEDTMLGLSSISFDMSILDVFLPLSVGARLRLVDRATAPDGLALARLAEQAQASFILATPSTWRLLLAGGYRPPRPVTGVAGGEALTQDLVAALLELGVRLYNGYGVTEACACTCLWRVTDAAAPMRIGAPSPNTRAWVLGPEDEVLPVGVEGELVLGGVGVGLGYHRRAELTAERFTPDPERPGQRRYRTGDRARWEPEGVLSFVGRDDDQVKVRGVRVELGEVEAVLLEAPAVVEACVVLSDRGPGDPQLVAFAVLADAADDALETARRHLAERLPAAFVPARIHAADELPRTASGKLDRRALVEREGRGLAPVRSRVSPAPGLEARIAALVAEVLGLGDVGATDPFVALGGASLAATRLRQRLRDELGMEIPLARILAGGSPRELAAEAGGAEAEPGPAPLPRDRPLPLSAEQAQLWFIQALDPASVAYHTPLSVALEGRLDEAALVTAWAALLERHEVLRSRWRLVDGVPSQEVAPGAPEPLPVWALDALPEPERGAREAELERAVHLEPFDLERGPVVRAALLRYGPERHRLVACLHHIASDGASLAVLQADLGALYAAATGQAPPPAPLAVQIADVAAWQAGRDHGADEDLRAWRRRLDGAPERLALPGARVPPPRRDERAMAWPVELGGEGVDAASRALGATPFAVLLAAFGALLRVETGQGDLVLGTLVAERDRPETAALIGHLARTVVLRLDVSGEPSFGALVERTRSTLLETLSAAPVPFDRLVAALSPERGQGQQPLFQTVFAWQDPPLEPTRQGSLAMQALEAFHGAAPFDLLVQCWRSEAGYVGSVIHRTDRLPAEAGRALALRLQALVSALTADVEAPAFAPRAADLALQARILARPGVLDAHVGPRPRRDGGVDRVAWVVQESPAPLEPEHDVRLLPVARLPLREDGRVDRDALRDEPLLDDRALAALAGDPETARALVVSFSRRRPALHLETLLDDAPLTPATAEAPPGQSPEPERAAPRASAPLALREGPPLVMPADAPTDLPAALRRAARQAPQRGVTHLETDGSERFVSWPELLATAERVAAALQADGLRPGDAALLVSDRSADFLAGLWGALLAGVVPVPMAPTARWEPEVGQAQRLVGVYRMLGDPPILAGGGVGQGLDAARDALGIPDARVRDIEALARTPGRPAPVALEPDSPAIFLLTSGSTGVPKAVTHVQSTVLTMLEAYGRRHGFGEDEVFLNWLGLDHVAPLFMVHLSAVWQRASHVNAPTARFSADPALALDWATRFGATSTFIANFAFGLIADAAQGAPAGRWDLSRFRVLSNGGECIVARTARRFLQVLAPHGLPPEAMVPIWGMSETGSATITALDFRLETSSDDDPFVPIGDPVEGFAMRVVDGEGTLLPEGSIGRLQVRGDQLQRGYHLRPEANRESFTEDGWFDTGDLAFIDARGMSIAGRAKDVIIIHGVNFYSHDIEAVVEGVPGVSRSFVAACPVRPAGADTDQVAIFFAPEDADDEALPELCARIRGAVAREAEVAVSYLLPVARESIPKTEIGKIQRPRLRKAFEAGEFDALRLRVDALCHGPRTVPDWFFAPVWRPREAAPDAEPPTALLVVGGAPAVAGALGRASSDAGAGAVERVSVEALADRLEPWRSGAGERPAVVLLAPEPGEAPRDPEALLEAALDRCEGLIALARALEPAGERPLRLVVETRLAELAAPGDPGSVADAPLLGLCASLGHEVPALDLRHVDHDLQHPDAVAALMLDELRLATRGEVDVAWRGGRRLVRRLDRVRFEPGARLPAPPARWVLTGGLGGVGRVLAERLLERPGTRLLLVGRLSEAELPPERRDALAALRARGAVDHAAADVACAGALAEVVAAQERLWGAPVDAVAHLAAVMPSGLVSRLARPELAAALRPRLLGTVRAAALLDDRPGARFFDHSSVNALFGGFGAGAYSAGSRVGESVVAGLRARGVRASWLCWSLWADRGLTRGLATQDLAARRGFLPLDARRGADSHALLLAYDTPQVLIGLDDGAPPVRRLLSAGPLTTRALRADALPPGADLHDSAGLPLPLSRGSRGERAEGARPARGAGGEARDEVQRRVAAIWRDLLEVSDLGIDDNFFDLGGHSMLLARLMARVEREFGRATPMVVLFENPTVRSLAAWLASGDGAPPPPVGGAGARDRAAQQRRALNRPRPPRPSRS
ncbi:MAG: amino acid adenylation domain-containing protein [Deltaproteobacteria bacterium]|nr:amino acid adenylation domain-containing protein [Deltaproteobacteria bacterium]MCB9787034.1 amino acid adenylation domain-containing protein [Deltaproteobacteria bacterium]